MKDKALKIWKYKRCIETTRDEVKRAEIGCNRCVQDQPECIYWIPLDEYDEIEAEIEW